MFRSSAPQPESRSATGVAGRSIAIPLALAGSIALHAGLGVAVGIRSIADDPVPGERLAFADFSVPTEAEDTRFVPLGNPESHSSSLTWIGYEEFEEMWAPKSEVDQALQNPEEPGSPVEPQVSVDDSIEQPATTTEPDPPTPTPETPAEPEPEERFVTLQEAPEAVSPEVEVPSDYSDLLELVDAIEDLTADIPRFNPIEAIRERRAALAARTDGEQVAAPEAEEPAAPPRPASEIAENPENAAPADSGQSGEKAQREADAAAINPVRNDDLGRPLAAQGLTIRTVRPTFSNVTRATARPRNPIAQIDFRRNGKPIRVSIIRSSGHEQVDIEIRKALYSWRASGEALLQLPQSEDRESPAYVSIKLEILL